MHQSAYEEKVLKKFCMDKSFLLSTPMLVHWLNVKNDSFIHKEDNKELFGFEVTYLGHLYILQIVPGLILCL